MPERAYQAPGNDDDSFDDHGGGDDVERKKWANENSKRSNHSIEKEYFLLLQCKRMLGRWGKQIYVTSSIFESHALLQKNNSLYKSLSYNGKKRKEIWKKILTEFIWCRWYSTHAGRTRVRFRARENPNDPKNWSAWFPNLPALNIKPRAWKVCKSAKKLMIMGKAHESVNLTRIKMYLKTCSQHNNI